MKMLRIPLLMMGLLLCSQGFAATAQQNKMTTCNAEATTKTLKGDERKAFMKTCLSAPAANDPDAAAAEDEGLQCVGENQSADRRCAQDVHEHLPQRLITIS
jgi:hypothetical protein